MDEPKGVKVKNDTVYKKFQKKRRKLLKQLEVGDEGESEEWEAVDMSKEVRPIVDYIGNREEMVQQMFSVVRGKRLERMLPPLLKGCDIDELKADCLIHLVGMSSKRIRSILEGKELDVSSDSDVSTIEGPSGIGQDLEDGCSVISGEDVKPLDPDTLEIGLSTSELCDFLDDGYSKSNGEKAAKKVKKKEEELSNPPDSGSSGAQVGKGKTLLEILELEMRARAIRALLKRDSPEPESESKEESTIVIDESEEAPNSSSGKSDETKGEKIETEKEQKKEELNETSNVEETEKDKTEKSWQERWLGSKDVKKVVMTSKMFTNVRKRMKRSMKDSKESGSIEGLTTNCNTSEKVVFSGSTDEYKNLVEVGKISNPEFIDDNSIDEEEHKRPELVNTEKDKSLDNDIICVDLIDKHKAECDKEN